MGELVCTWSQYMGELVCAWSQYMGELVCVCMESVHMYLGE